MSQPQFGERAEYGPNDVCYRHPDRPSFTLCQRCGNTICPDCQVVNPVGLLCPSCANPRARAAQEGTAAAAAPLLHDAQRRARVAGRRIMGADAPVTSGILVVCAAVYIVQLLSHWIGGDGVTQALWYAPVYSLPQYFEPWRLLTAMFTHSTGFVLHIVFNMYTLWLFGRNLEQLIGRGAFAALYLLSGLGGSVGVQLWGYVQPASVVVPTVGASGAIFGVMAATLVAYKVAGVNVASLAVLIAINLGIGFFASGVSWQAHLGGLLVGGLVMWLLLELRGPRKQKARLGALLAVALVLVLLALSYWIVAPLAV